MSPSTPLIWRRAAPSAAAAQIWVSPPLSGVSPEPDAFILAVDEALAEFAKAAPQQARVVELRYFGGLNEDEVAEVMKTSPRTVRRDWVFAKAWLQKELGWAG